MQDDRANDWLAQEMRREGYHLKGDHPAQARRGASPAQRLKRQHEQGCEASAIRDEHAAYCDAESVREESRYPRPARSGAAPRLSGALLGVFFVLVVLFVLESDNMSVVFILLVVVAVVGSLFKAGKTRNDDCHRR